MRVAQEHYKQTAMEAVGAEFPSSQSLEQIYYRWKVGRELTKLIQILLIYLDFEDRATMALAIKVSIHICLLFEK